MRIGLFWEERYDKRYDKRYECKSWPNSGRPVGAWVEGTFFDFSQNCASRLTFKILRKSDKSCLIFWYFFVKLWQGRYMTNSITARRENSMYSSYSSQPTASMALQPNVTHSLLVGATHRRTLNADKNPFSHFSFINTYRYIFTWFLPLSHFSQGVVVERPVTI